MLISLKREAPRGKAVFGRLVVDGGMLAMDTLENLTYAIPDGFYRVRMTYSPRFQEVLPILDGVIGRTGIRIHAGNTIEHTEGCILVGDADHACDARRLEDASLRLQDGAKRLQVIGAKERLLSSRKALNLLREYLLNYQKQNPYEEVYVRITSPSSELAGN